MNFVPASSGRGEGRGSGTRQAAPNARRRGPAPGRPEWGHLDSHPSADPHGRDRRDGGAELELDEGAFSPWTGLSDSDSLAVPSRPAARHFSRPFTRSTPARNSPASPRNFDRGGARGQEEHGEGDDEADSARVVSLETETVESRGRGRTREQRHSLTVESESKSALHETLRSSLAALLSLGSRQSLSPVVSCVSLTSLLGPSMLSPLGPRTHAFSPLPGSSAFATSLIQQEDDADDSGPEDEDDRLEDPNLSLRVPDWPASQPLHTTRSLPLPAPLRDVPAPPPPQIDLTRSSPTFARRKTRRRGQRRASLSPGPASVEERPRARIYVQRSGSDSEAEVRPDQEFLELVQTTRVFMQMAPYAEPASKAVAALTPPHLPPLPSTVPSSPTIAPQTTSASLASSLFLTSSVIDVSSSEGDPLLSTLESPSSKSNKKKDEPSWFDWARKSHRVKLWQLVAIAGIAFGIGAGAATIVHCPLLAGFGAL